MEHQDLRRALCGAFLALALGGSARAALVTVSSTETWDGNVNPHAGDGVTLSGSGTEASPRTYTIPSGMRITSTGRIILHGSSDYSIKLVIRGGDLQMDAGAVLNLERYKIRTGRDVLVLDLSGTNSITGAGQIGPITHRDSNPRVLTITNVMDVSLAEIDVHTENVNLDTNPRRHLNITAKGTVVVTENIDNSDDDTSGDGGADVNIKASAIAVHNVETRSMRDDGSARAANYNVLLQALSPLGNYNPNDSVNNSFTNKLTVTGGINTLGRTNLGGNVTLQSVVLQLIETGRIIRPSVGTKTVQVGVVRGGASADDLYLDSYGTAKTPASVVQWGDTAVIPPPPSGPTLVIDDINFHDATNSTLVGEGQVHSAGGTMFVAIRNTGATSELITKLTINGTALADLANLEWWRQQPSGYAGPGQVVSILAHIAGSPVTENASVTVAAECLSGQTGAVTKTLTTPKLRIGSVVPSADYQSLYLFLRNLDTVAWTVNDVYVNSNVTAQCTFVGGSTTISPSQVGIIKVAYGTPLAYLTPLSVRVNATRSGGSATTVGASIRLMDSEFNLGTWDSRAWSSKTNCSNLRDRYHHSVQIGAEDYDGAGITNGLPYYVRAAVPLYPSQKASVGYLKRIGQLASVYSWYNHDEPDINNITSTTLNWNSVTFFDVSAKPVMTTLVSTKMFNEMGWTVDMPTMDHYAHNAPLVNSTPTTHLLQEVLWYSDKLKENTEPLRAWNWCQGVAPGTWGTQPFAWSIESQFWTHIMCGVKGIKWFKAAATNDVAYPNELNRIESCVRRFEQVKYIALFGESINCTSSSNVKAPTRGIVGEDAMIAVVASHNDSKPFSSPYSLGALTVTVTVNVPPWIPIQHVTQVGAGNDPNPTTPAYTVSGQTVTITGIALDNTTANGSAKVFLIGRNDTTPPDAPTGLMKARDLSPTAIELSWEGARDNYGVKGYRVYRNGVQIGDTYGLVYTDTGYSAGAFYTVKAYDTATNLSAAATVNGLPGSPTGLAALVTNSMVRLTWSAAVGATGYNVRRSMTPGGSYSVVAATAATTYDDAAVTVGLPYYYVVTATNSAGQGGTSAELGVNVVAAPEVSVPPASRTNNAATTATFTVTATGGFLSYQWRKGTQDLVNGANISGASTPTLTLTAVSQTDAGNYSVVVSNAAGTATSAVASLTVIGPPPPTLWFEAAPAGQVSLYWSGTVFVLQQNADLSNAGGWVNAPTGTNMPAVVPVGGSNLFYRLKWPD